MSPVSRYSSTVFAEGSPLNVTNLTVGPDGWLYFCTGGRGSEGGIYRIVWMGQVPTEVTQLGGAQRHLEAARGEGVEQLIGLGADEEEVRLAGRLLQGFQETNERRKLKCTS